MSRPYDLRPVESLAEDKPHGTRLKYLAGCKCPDCRKANCEYAKKRHRAQARGDWNGIVTANAARKHLRKLARSGVGTRTVEDITGIARSILCGLRSGKRKNLRARTEQKILAVSRDAYGDARLLPADKTWVLLRRLLREGFTRTELARRLGSSASPPALQIRKNRVTAKTELKVRKLYDGIMRI